MAKFYKPTRDVIELVETVMRRHHESLEDARIGVLFRDEAQMIGNNKVGGEAKRVKDIERAAGLDYHFILIFAKDVWRELAPHQREALVDHELCHCLYDAADEKARIRPHDFEEFNEIIERHGLWWPGAQETQRAIQAHTLPLFGRQGRVEAVDAEFAKSLEA